MKFGFVFVAANALLAGFANDIHVPDQGLLATHASFQANTRESFTAVRADIDALQFLL